MAGLVDGFAALKAQNRNGVKVSESSIHNGLYEEAQIRHIEGLNLTKEEFTKACYVGQAIIDYKPTENSDVQHDLENIFKQEMKSRFSYASKFATLELKDNFNSDDVNIIVTAARFEKDRPFMFLIYDPRAKMGTVLDEKQFDAFNQGPFKRPQI